MNAIELPLFPLHTVLFPGGPLGLRIFETRYLDMVSDCMKHGRCFAVLLIKEGHEAGPAAQFFAIGTAARIVDFDRLDDGMLGIRCRGEQPVRVLAHHVQTDGLLVGQVELQPAAPPRPVPDDYAGLTQLLRTMLDYEEARPYTQQLEIDFDNADWVSYRLAELLPLPLAAKQALLEMTDPLQRLQLFDTAFRKQDLL